MQENPYKSPGAVEAAAKHGSSLKDFWFAGIKWGVLGLVLVMLAFALLLPATRGGGREASRRSHCQSNLKQIALALLNYEQANGALPPAFTVDADGNRLHSWRTLLLPFLDESALFEKIDLTKPWDDPVNAFANELIVDAFVCPSSGTEEFFTTYQVAVGSEYLFSGAVPRKLSEVTDGTSFTLAVVDVSDRRAVPWMSPEDVVPEELLARNAESRTQHMGVMLAAFLDGHIEAIPDDLSQEARRAMLTIAGGEPRAN